MNPEPASLTQAQRLRRLKLRYLVLLVVVDDLRSLHKAARAMHISQPAATKLLAEVERLVGTRLFDRTTRGLAPNSYGASLVRHARKVLETIGFAWEELDALQAGKAGRIRVGTIMAAEATLLPRAVARLKETHPSLTISIRGGTFDSLVPELAAGSLDLVLARVSDDRDMSGIRHHVLHDNPMTIVVRAGHPLLDEADPDLGMLAGYPWIWPPAGSVYQARLVAAFRRQELELPLDLVESESMLVNEALVRSSDRIVALPATVASYLHETGAFKTLAVELPAPSGQLGILLPDPGVPNTSVQAMVDALRGVAQEVAGA
jgi:DNA-binding transcriptional LysR family regulator